MITISVVSHGQAGLVSLLLQDLVPFREVGQIVITENIPDRPITIPEALAKKIVWRRNVVPLGFGANHDQAFQQCQSPYFCVLNPDIRIAANPFPLLLAALGPSVSLSAPAVTDSTGVIEDSARHFPTPYSLLRKALGGDDGTYRYALGDPPFSPDWIAGMFMLFPTEEFARLGGFDARYFLYYEDVDICARIRKTGRKVVLEPRAVVCHDAQRTSRRNLRYMKWHFTSLLRYLSTHWL